MREIRNIVLTKRSREALSKITENQIFGSVAEQIEGTTWSFPFDDVEFSVMRDKAEEELRKFFSLEKDVPVEIKRFDSNILSFCTGVHPDYEKEKGDPDYWPGCEGDGDDDNG